MTGAYAAWDGHEFRDDFERELWTGVVRFAWSPQPGDSARAKRLEHLARGYAAGIGQDEVLERITAGELEGAKR